MDLTELHALVAAEHPEIATATDDWTVVTTLRAFAAAHVDYVVNIDSPYYVELGGNTVEDRFSLFEANGGGVVCGGTADALAELARSYGYSSWLLGIGDTSDGGFTHMQTLIALDVDGETLLTLHDPSADTSYTDADGAPLDYFAMLTTLAGGDVSDVDTTSDRVAADNLVSATETADIATFAEGSWTVDPEDYTVIALADGWTVRSPRTAERFQEVIGPWFGPFLARAGLPEDAVWLELFPYAIYGEDGDGLLALAQATIAGTATIGFEASEGFVVGDTGGTVNQRYTAAGYWLQTWYYGGITVIAAGDGQALQVDRVDGVGGDEEGIFELQGMTVGSIGATVESSDGGLVRVQVKDSAYTLLHTEDVPSGSTFSWSDPAQHIWRLVVEAEGDVVVDDLRYGPPEAEEPEDTGHGDSGDSGHPDTSPDTDPRDSGPVDMDDTPAAPPPAEGGCGCATPGDPGAGWLALPALLSRRRR